MFRKIGKACREAWVWFCAIGFVLADANDLLDGHWLNDYDDIITLLIVAWLLFFAIGVAREEPTP